MEEKKPANGDKDGNSSSKAHDQFTVDKEFGEDAQAIRDKQAFADKQPFVDKQLFVDKQAFVDKQVDVPAAPPKVVDLAVGPSGSDNDKSFDKSGPGVMPNGEILKQPPWSFDDTALHVDQMVAA